MDESVPTNDGVITNFHMPADSRHIVNLDALAQDAVVPDMAVSHQKTLVTDDRIRFRLRASVDGGTLADDHPIADGAEASVPTEMEILR